MKKFLLPFLLVVTCCAPREANRSNVGFFDYRYIKPSESMQAGVPKVNNSNFQLDWQEDSYSKNFKTNDSDEVSGAAYFPQSYVEFEEVGAASWYGADFHGKYTANGEIYDSGAMSAAHRTLPLPSMVRITNLRNGRVAIVRVNDRGPFSGDRVIDVSEKAAEELGFKDQGTTKVYIQLLRDDTDKMIKKTKVKN